MHCRGVQRQDQPLKPAMLTIDQRMTKGWDGTACHMDSVCGRAHEESV
jgi:hypothetical protein